MEIIRTQSGFVEVLDHHSTIDMIEFLFPQKCIVKQRDGSISSFDMKTDIFNYQYGIPASADGSMLFKGSWRDGIDAISTNNGTIVWHSNQKRIRRIFVYELYIIVISQGYALIKLDALTGEVIAEVKSTSIEDDFQLSDSCVLVDRIKGDLCVLDTEKMMVTKRYSHSQYNPRNCLSFIIRNAYLIDGKLLISGFEDYPNKDYSCLSQEIFVRVLE